MRAYYRFMLGTGLLIILFFGGALAVTIHRGEIGLTALIGVFLGIYLERFTRDMEAWLRERREMKNREASAS